jgi:hypothetical protein
MRLRTATSSEKGNADENADNENGRIKFVFAMIFVTRI